MINEKQKKVAMEDEQERSTVIYMNSIVGGKVKEEYPNKTAELYTELMTNRNENVQAIYSSLQQDKISNSLQTSISPSDYEHVNEKNKKMSKSSSVPRICLVLSAILLLVLLTVITSVAISLTMRSSSGTSPNEEFMNTLMLKIEKNTLNLSLKILAIEKELSELKKSDVFNFDLDLVYLVNQLNETSSNVINKINQINIAIYGKIVSFPAPSCRAIYLLHPYSTSG